MERTQNILFLPEPHRKKENPPLEGFFLQTPIGEILCVYEGRAIAALALTEVLGRAQTTQVLGRSVGEISIKRKEPSVFGVFKNAENKMQDFLCAIAQNPFLVRGTPFQINVWQVLTTIRFGEQCSYSALADRVGLPLATRAVASAVAANPVAILIPCHRIIYKNGTIGGFRWGVDLKQRLLALESANP
jgi:O-6-methylguanine DNA methyltransferase